MPVSYRFEKNGDYMIDVIDIVEGERVGKETLTRKQVEEYINDAQIRLAKYQEVLENCDDLNVTHIPDDPMPEIAQPQEEEINQ